MRGFAILMVLALTVVSCGGADHGPPISTTPSAATVNPERIARVRADLPPGYEVAGIAEHSAPVTFWGLRPGWIADPEFCGPLGDPGPGVPSGGWSASGAGGIVYAVVAGPGAQLSAPDGCRTWTVSGGQTIADITQVPAPVIDAVPTVAMNVVAGTVVEGGTQTRSHADTVIGYLDGYVVSVTVVTDPGAALPALPAELAATLLANAVTAVRG